MKILREDKVMVIAGRNKGTKGTVLAVLPKKDQIVVEGVNIVKRHTKPSAADPKGGIIEQVRPIDASKVMVLDPKTGKPARVGYKINSSGKKERIFRVSSFTNPKTKAATKSTKKTKEAKS